MACTGYSLGRSRYPYAALMGPVEPERIKVKIMTYTLYINLKQDLLGHELADMLMSRVLT